MAATMTPDQAHAFRTARGNEARLLNRKSGHELIAILRAECGGWGTYSKDEAVASLLEHRYPLAKENEAIHVLYHQDTIWDQCQHCEQDDSPITYDDDDDPPEYEPDDGEAQRIAEVYADAKAELDRGL